MGEVPVTWPAHGLVLRTPSLVLRGMSERDAEALAAVVPEDVEHDPSFPDLTSGQKVLRQYWRAVATWTTDSWELPFVVLRDDLPIGLQALEGKDFRARRTVDTASWLVPSARGRGNGKQMRSAVLSLAFEHLGAAVAVSEAWEDNASSLGVSRALGYRDNGVDVHAGGRRMQRLLLERWEPPFPVQVEGLEGCFVLLGL
ncbi:MAG: hypothetical protein JWO12_3614 [Frankiales bacterium]|nr:hypothetical protein [Frankiales bacterium]